MKWLFCLVPLFVTTASMLAQSPEPTASPQEGYRQHWRHSHERFLEKLNLSEQQRDQIKKFRADNKGAFRTAKLNFLTAEKTLQDAIYKNPTDEATISSLSASVNSARTQLTIQRAKLQAMIAGILNSDQRQTWDQMHQKRQDKLQKRIDRLNRSVI